MENPGRICKYNTRLCKHDNLICVQTPGIHVIGNKHGNYGYTWYFLTMEMENGRYQVEFISGAISTNSGSTGAWYGGNCIWYDGIKDPVPGLDLPDGYSFLPGSQSAYQTAEAASNDNKGKIGYITITKGGISICFKDTNVTDNVGSIIYQTTKLG